MSYFAPYLDENGLHMPTYADVMEHLVSNYRQIFGQDIYIGEDSQDYQLLSMYAKAWDDLQAVILDTYNARNPMYATGSALDLLLPIVGIRRLPATPSTVILKVRGTAGTALPSGSIALDANGSQWKTTDAVIFGVDGYAEVDAQCLTSGSVTAEAHTIKRIDTPAYNWSSVDNDLPAVPGRSIESDAELRKRYARSVSLSARSTLDSLRDAIANISGVHDFIVVENNSSDQDPRGIPGHSICAVVDGGSSKEIAKTIFLKKAPGIGTHGKGSDVYVDRYGNSNTIRYSRPTKNEVHVQVDIERRDGWDSAVMEEKIKRAIADYINNLQIGEPLYVSALYGPCYQANVGEVPSFVVFDIDANTAEISGSVITVPFDGKLICNLGDVSIRFNDPMDSIPST